MLDTFTWCGHASPSCGARARYRHTRDRAGNPGVHDDVVGAFGRDRQTGMDRVDGAELYLVVAAWPRGSRLSDREWANGVLERSCRTALAAADGTHAAAYGTDAYCRRALGPRR